jgi:hypothetical protein
MSEISEATEGDARSSVGVRLRTWRQRKDHSCPKGRANWD